MLQRIRLFLSAHLEKHSLKPDRDFSLFFFKGIPLFFPPFFFPGTPVLSGALKLCTETTCRHQLPLPLFTWFQFPVIHYLMLFSALFSLPCTTPPLFFLKKKKQKQQANLLSFSISSSTKSKSAGLQWRN